ncbi:MAG: transcriptional repressor [Candidatus Marinimicrobia bacterium]|jgi:Fe2+ or Zn2+ uptake regulation protein|nr:transcriptional repressor [Candidatus Neomarinimicrobiota bacterium]MBT3618546.1 transcriptional repressor [Candidatus Neomarinimicrobiota bacterium]MBT3828952.1 transcriptional repressor [Candidatus Neomarinimicrobiota bacterium]MBT3997336.1 transcriptional repressor [Candidatus Neomarinimicrobiota bacterium]MBT4281142.1 transcriptional repressor [Candidatus Neomarinimicrobiota bacterium]
MNQKSRQLKKALKKEGLRYTSQRQAIWDEICSSDEHRDVEELFISIRQAGIKVSRATVYRTIDVLVKNNLVRKLDLGDGRSLYEHKIDPTHHDHLVCIRCGRIEEFMMEEIESLQDRIAKKHNFKLIRHIHQLFGICSECR